MTERLQIIRERIKNSLGPLEIEVSDDGHLHIGHAGAAAGAGHYSVKVISDKFTGLNRIKRHQLIYAAVSDMMPDQIHALSIQAYTDDENQLK